MYLQTDVWQHWSELLENIYAADMEMKIKTKKNKNTNQHSAMFAWRDYNDYTYSNNTLRNTNYFCVCVCVCALVLCIFRPCTQFFPWMFKRFFFRYSIFNWNCPDSFSSFALLVLSSPLTASMQLPCIFYLPVARTAPTDSVHRVLLCKHISSFWNE